ncbi:ankyrin repeat domain-containing protein SOWAHC-like [Scleropages formosus]|uniref:ankyrin repeat domain-containing protein SOWAHC-like n=1 Tax=Scleropages formosus TaxID=113540 RepID=UPI00087890ED|nr:ankyrin repeat domain-containing protein SOWAHC-like [Scleropages formosus]
MATDCTQESVLQFLLERGGKAKHAEITDHFKSVLPGDPAKRAAARETFKGYVDNVAVVRTENGVKYVCVKKKYRGSEKCAAERADGECNGNGLSPPESPANGGAVPGQNYPKRSGSGVTLTGYLALEDQHVKNDATPEASPGTGPGASKERALTSPSVASAEIFPPKPEVLAGNPAPVEPAVINSLEKNLLGKVRRGNSGEEAKWTERGCGSPDGSVTPVASPADVGDARPNLNRPVRLKDCPDRGVLRSEPAPLHQRDERTGRMLCGRKMSGDADSASRVNAEAADRGPSKGVCLGPPVSRRRTSRGSQRSLLLSNLSEDGAGEGPLDSASVSGRDGSTPSAGRKSCLELTMNSPPQVRRSKLHRNPGHHSVRYRERESMRSDSDSASLVSSIDEDSGIVTLDPLEHEWMMCSSDGRWEILHRLLLCEPNLVTKKDFVTGFTCLHWAAKQGKQELLALLVNFAKQHGVPINVNARSSAGYTPLHLAAMHSHMEVVKLLVGAYDADVDARDYSGKKASQYLSGSVSEGIRDIIGATVHPDDESAETGPGRWRLSKVLHSNFKLLNHPEEDAVDGGGAVKYKPLYRKSSMNRIKPRLQKIRFRTQIVHSTSFREAEEGENLLTSPVNSRPKSNLFS